MTDFLYQFLVKIIASSGLDGACQVFLQESSRYFGCEQGIFTFANPAKKIIEIKAIVGLEPNNHWTESDTESFFEKPITNLVLQKDRPQFLDHLSLQKQTEPGETFYFPDSKSLLSYREHLDIGDEIIVILESKQAQKPSADIDLLRLMVKNVINLLKSRKRSEKRAKELSWVWDVKREVSAFDEDLDISEMSGLLGKILRLALSRTNTKNGAILMVDEETSDLLIYQEAIKGSVISKNGITTRRFYRRKDRPSGLCYWIFDNNKAYMTLDATKDPNYVPLFKEIKSSLGVPISFQDRCIGVIIVESVRRNAFVEADRHLLLDLAQNVTMFVRRAQLYEETKKKGVQPILIRGLSQEWQEVERRVEKSAATNATVMLRGESGTGKELVAHSTHFNSPRKHNPFVVVNCAAIPEQLLESTFFGHVKGAFTGATYDRIGEFEKAEKGTIFLDEIGDLSLPLQVKLLRVLQTGEIMKIGSNELSQVVDVRVIAATSRNLEDMIKKGSFREDLYYRLHVVPIFLPPLRSYRDSIPGMIKSFIEQSNREYGKKIIDISSDSLNALINYDFPGNVSELKNIIEQAVILEDNEKIQINILPQHISAPIKEALKKSGLDTIDNDNLASNTGKSDILNHIDIFQDDYKSLRQHYLQNFERQYLEQLLAEYDGNMAKAAAMAGINRVNLYKLAKKHNLNPDNFRKEHGQENSP